MHFAAIWFPCYRYPNGTEILLNFQNPIKAVTDSSSQDFGSARLNDVDSSRAQTNMLTLNRFLPVDF